MNTIILKIRARHFKNAVFIDNCGCAIAKAARNKFRAKAEEGVFKLIVTKKDSSEKIYAHQYYSNGLFEKDYRKAKRAKFGDKVIRELTLTLRS